jgi:thiol-disulfide isomerase/thioredoxin
VEAPYKDGDLNPVDTTDTTAEKMPVFVQKVLVEDYTGFTCGHCPKAADEAKRLHNEYGDRIVIMGVHAGDFANPKGSYTYNFKTPMGDEWNTFFKIIAYPAGMINRIGFPEKKNMLAYTAWRSKVDVAVNKKDSLVAMSLEPTYDAANRMISLKVLTGFLKAADTNTYLSVHLVEDSIVNYQLDYRNETAPNIPDYVHMHVLRHSLNGTWGDRISPTAIPAGKVFKRTYTYQIPAGKDWKPEHMKVVAYVHKYKSTYEVINADEAKLTK